MLSLMTRPSLIAPNETPGACGRPYGRLDMLDALWSPRVHTSLVVELAAVDGEHLARHRRGQVGDEEQCGSGHLLPRREPLEVGRCGLLGVDVVVGDPGLGGQPVEVALVDVFVDVR